ncbi:ABC transporter ATP-binding protein [Gordonia malaquae]|uniref:ABC transporter ATP-binding protein n=1 Tax=Gordonia malaquae TaxID=410332 RepID=UPI0030C79D18
MKIEVEGVTVRRGRRTVIDGAGMTVASGSVVGLLGPNGSGKSTLLRVISGLIRADAGRVRLDGTDLSDLTRKETAMRIAVMAQESPGEFDMSALDLVLLGRLPHGRGFGRDSAKDVDVAWRALEQVRSGDLAARPVATLSGGERQRVLLARALAQDTPLLVLDEPTNHLDVAHRLELLDLVRSSGRTVLMALHDLDLVGSVCDEVAVLVEGRVSRQGSPADVLDPELFRSAFEVHATPIDHPVTGRRHHVFDASIRDPNRTTRPQAAGQKGNSLS